LALVAAKFIWLVGSAKFIWRKRKLAKREALPFSRMNSEVPTVRPTLLHFLTGVKSEDCRIKSGEIKNGSLTPKKEPKTFDCLPVTPLVAFGVQFVLRTFNGYALLAAYL